MGISTNDLVSLLMADAEGICSKLDFSFLRGKTVMVAGASGLLGTHFLATLRKMAEKTGDIRTVAVMNSSPFGHIEALLDYGNSKAICGDIADNDFLASLPQADIIIHSAGYGQPGRFMEDPVNTIKVNTAGTFGFLDKLLPGGKFLFSSTSELYSGLPNPPYSESQIGTTNTDHPRACYIEAKRCGEAICNAYRMKGVEAKSVRISLAYGPGIRVGDRRAVNSFIEKALVKKEINMLDRGMASRTYCYVTDAVYMQWLILLHGKEPVYNVGGISRMTIGELAQKIGALTNASVRLPDSGKTGLEGAPADVSLDMTRFEKEFHPMSYVPLDDGISRTITWLRSLLEWSAPAL